MKETRTTSLGTLSLTVSIGGLIATETALRYGWLAAPGWKVLLQAFEAATVGGLADWFAVSALFREIPVPLIRRHTNIIVRNRERIVDGIADMVQNRWLAPKILREHLGNFSASQYALDFLSNEDHFEAIIEVMRDIIRQFARGIDAPEVVTFVERALKDQLRDLNWSEAFGRWLGQRIRSGDHQGVWNILLPVIEKALREPDLKVIVQRTIARALEEYKKGGLLKRLAVDLARGLDLVKEEDIAAAFLSQAEEVIREARAATNHPLRARIERPVIEFADKLAAGDADVVAVIDKLYAVLIDKTDAHEILGRGLGRLGETLGREFQESKSDLNTLMRRTLHERLDDFRADPSAQKKFDRWITKAVLELIEQRHSMIGQMVRGSLEKLSDLDLVGQIEEKIGRDLQYIRLNGAIVGGLAGAALAMIKLLV